MGTVADYFPKHLVTERLSLELFDRSDAQHVNVLLTAFNTPTAVARMGGSSLTTAENFDHWNAQRLLRGPKFAGGSADRALIYIIGIENQGRDREPVGVITLAQRDVRTRSGLVTFPPDIGWAMLEGQMGKGFATEAATEVLRCVREDFGQDEVVVFLGEQNRQSTRVAEKLGFVSGGRCPKSDHPEQSWQIMILPGMDRFDYV